MISTPATKLASGTVTSPSNPSHRPLDIDTLYHTRAILSVQWSIDSEHLYFDTNITGRYNIWAVPSNRGWPVQLTVSDERTLLQEPSPDGRFLLYAQDIQGDEKPNLYLLDLTEFTIRNITNTDKVGYRDAKWSPDGRSLVFAGERDGPGTYPVFHFDPDKGTIKKIIGHEAGDCESLEYSPDGRKLALTRTRNYQYTGASVYDLETGNETMLAPIDDKSTTITGGWTRDGQRVYVTSNANDRGIDAVALLELKQGPEFQWLTLQDWDSQLVDVSPTEDRCAYVVNEAGNLRLLLRDLNGEEEEIPPTQGVVRAARFSPDGKRLAIIHLLTRRLLPVFYTSRPTSKPITPIRPSSSPMGAPSGNTSTAGFPTFNITQATATWSSRPTSAGRPASGANSPSRLERMLAEETSKT